MVVRDEAPIIADCVGHLLHHLRLDRVYVTDNGSTDGTSAILARIAAADARLQVTQVPGAFHQAAMMATITERAMQDGATWLLPSDADEFLWLSAAALRRLCAAAPPGSGGFALRVVNFVQWRRVRHDRPGSLATMLFRGVPHGRWEDAQALVTDRTIPFLRMTYPRKLLLRAAPFLRMQRGQHNATGMAGPLIEHPAADLLHAPIRARSDLASRVEHGRRLLEIDPDPSTGWHLKRLVALDADALEAEWRANSFTPADAFGSRMRPDPRFAWIAARQRRFRRAMARP